MKEEDKDWFIAKANERGGDATEKDDTPEAYLDALRRAFVEHKADFVILEEQMIPWIWRSARWAFDEGILDPRWYEEEHGPQYSCFKCYLTEAGKARLGIKHDNAL